VTRRVDAFAFEGALHAIGRAMCHGDSGGGDSGGDSGGTAAAQRQGSAVTCATGGR